MTKDTFYKELRALAIPLALHNLLTALVGASDALLGCFVFHWPTIVVSCVGTMP